jgi:hypothetical protein
MEALVLFLCLAVCGLGRATRDHDVDPTDWPAEAQAITVRVPCAEPGNRAPDANELTGRSLSLSVGR